MDTNEAVLEAPSADTPPVPMEHEESSANECAAVGAKSPTTATPQTVKKSRKRKKQIYNAIRQQMEFYFGDANLSKDRFLKKLIADDPGKNTIWGLF